MKVGDQVKMIGDKTRVWKITRVKSDSRAFWIQINDVRYTPDVWHDSSYFEVING